MVGPPSYVEPVMSEVASTPSKGVFTRLYWMLIGPIAVFAAASLLIKHPSWSFGWRDLLFWAAIASVIGARWLDVRRYGGLNADGTPSTNEDVKRHAGILGGVGVAVWLLGQTLAI